MVRKELKTDLLREIDSRKDVIRKEIIEWGRNHYRHFPWRDNRTPYSVLISEILLKRTTASAVLHLYERFMNKYPNLKALARASKEDLENLLLRIGYNVKRATILVEVANYIIKKYDGQIPRLKAQLLEIPNIGNYTANAILTLGYNIPSAMVDSNVERIIRRLFLEHLSNQPLRLVQKVADALAPREDNQTYNFALLDFGALVCRYGIPKCKVCPINEICDYFLSGNPFSD